MYIMPTHCPSRIRGAQWGCPQAQGGWPQAQGDCPLAQGGCPQAQGDCHQVQGDCPLAQGGCPRLKKVALRLTETAPAHRKTTSLSSSELGTVSSSCSGSFIELFWASPWTPLSWGQPLWASEPRGTRCVKTVFWMAIPRQKWKNMYCLSNCF